MRNEYKKPVVSVISFETFEAVANNPGFGEEVESWGGELE